MDFYGRVRQLAKKPAYSSLQELILSVGMKYDSYYSLKTAGNLPRADDALKLARALGVSVEYLVTGVNPEVATGELLNEMQAIINRYRKNTERAGRKKPRIPLASTSKMG